MVVVVQEATLNIFDRDDKYSAPGYYFSFFELSMETMGFYGDDLRLSLFITNTIQFLLENINSNIFNNALQYLVLGWSYVVNYYYFIVKEY